MLMNIGELAARARVTVRTLRHYDRIGLLRPTAVTESGYRQYDDSTLERLYIIRLFRELEFPLEDIRRIIDTPGFDPIGALDKQITLLTMRREHIDNLILMAKGLKMTGMKNIDFSAFDARRLDDYARQAKAAWNKTDAWQEYESRARSPKDDEKAGQQLMDMIAVFGQRRSIDPACDEAQQMIQQLRDHITGSFYTCTVPILRSLADMYDGGGDFTRNIDKAGGCGTAAFLAQAMRIYCDAHAGE